MKGEYLEPVQGKNKQALGPKFGPIIKSNLNTKNEYKKLDKK